MMNFNEIIAKAKEITNSGLPFMEGRDKGNMSSLINTVATITDYGYMNDDGKDYVCFVCKEEPTLFFFGGSVLTDSVKKLDQALTDVELEELLDSGLPVLFENKKSKNKREYTKCTFFPTNL